MEKIENIMNAHFVETKRKENNQYPININTSINNIHDDMNTDNNIKYKGLVITNDSVYEYDMDCLMKNKKCY